MKVIPHEDFSHLVIINNEVSVLFRELTGRDIYFVEQFRDDDEDSSFLNNSDFLHAMIERLSIDPYGISEDELTNLQIKDYVGLLEWFCQNRLCDRVMTLNNWLTLCFHLGKQRWSSDLDWYESQPIIKIVQMANIQSDFHEKVNSTIAKNTKK